MTEPFALAPGRWDREYPEVSDRAWFITPDAEVVIGWFLDYRDAQYPPVGHGPVLAMRCTPDRSGSGTSCWCDSRAEAVAWVAAHEPAFLAAVAACFESGGRAAVKPEVRDRWFAWRFPALHGSRRRKKA